MFTQQFQFWVIPDDDAIFTVSFRKRKDYEFLDCCICRRIKPKACQSRLPTAGRHFNLDRNSRILLYILVTVLFMYSIWGQSFGFL